MSHLNAMHGNVPPISFTWLSDVSKGKPQKNIIRVKVRPFSQAPTQQASIRLEELAIHKGFRALGFKAWVTMLSKIPQQAL